MILYTRKDNTPLETLSTLSSDISMNGKWALDYPDGVSPLSLQGTPSDVITREIEPQMLRLYPSYEHVVFNSLEDSSTGFDTTARFPTNVGQMPSRYKIGTTPNVACMLANNNAPGAGRYGVLISDEIDITALTSDGLGRQTYLPYWRVVAKNISQDKSPVEGYSTANQPALLTYEEIADDGTQYNVYLSEDNGNTYEQGSVLRPHSFAGTVDTIRIAFVNTSQTDLYILSYALMF